jgi:hypothetical protein
MPDTERVRAASKICVSWAERSSVERRLEGWLAVTFESCEPGHEWECADEVVAEHSLSDAQAKGLERRNEPKEQKDGWWG